MCSASVFLIYTCIYERNMVLGIISVHHSPDKLASIISIIHIIHNYILRAFFLLSIFLAWNTMVNEHVDRLVENPFFTDN